MSTQINHTELKNEVVAFFIEEKIKDKDKAYLLKIMPNYHMAKNILVSPHSLSNMSEEFMLKSINLAMKALYLPPFTSFKDYEKELEKYQEILLDKNDAFSLNINGKMSYYLPSE